jgi:hypothetical protein
MPSGQSLAPARPRPQPRKPPVVDDELLRRDVRFPADLLGQVINELEGPEG